MLCAIRRQTLGQAIVTGELRRTSMSTSGPLPPSTAAAPFSLPAAAPTVAMFAKSARTNPARALGVQRSRSS